MIKIEKITQMGNQFTGIEMTREQLNLLSKALELSHFTHVIWFLDLETKKRDKILIIKNKEKV